jgi:hypothetical protein
MPQAPAPQTVSLEALEALASAQEKLLATQRELLALYERISQ